MSKHVSAGDWQHSLNPNDIQPACVLARSLKVPDNLAIGLAVAEQALNVSTKDRVEDVFLRTALAVHEAAWWDTWAARSEDVAGRHVDDRARMGRWPSSSQMNGYVISFGPAQITPRTVLTACRDRPTLAVCKGGTRAIISRLLRTDTALEMGTIVISAEQDRYCKLANIKTCVLDTIMLANLYNYGSDIYFLNYRDRRHLTSFSRYVENWTAHNRAVCSHPRD